MIAKYDKKYDLDRLLEHLEKECGGHGNGYATFSNGHLLDLKKGVKVTTGECAKHLLADDYEYAIFHTRIASCGEIADERTHPFTTGDITLAMNGTLYDMTDIAKAIDKTDTEVLLSIIQSLPLDKAIKAMEATNSVFVGMFNGVPFAIKNAGSLAEYAPKNASGIMFASSFPPYVKDAVTLPDNFKIVDGARTKGTPKITASYWHGAYKSYRATKSLYGYEYEYIDDGSEYDDDEGSYIKSELELLSEIEDKKTIIPSEKAYDGSSGSYEDGYTDGYDEGYEGGYERGYKEGYNEGYNEGYDASLCELKEGLAR
jgi:hypothetical protein